MKKIRNKVISLLLGGAIFVSAIIGFVACDGTGANDPQTGNEGSKQEEPKTYSLDFSEQVTSWKKTESAKNDLTYYSAQAVYCRYPTDSKVQSLILYAHEDYFNADGTVNTTNTVGNYTATTAPIIYINSTSGYSGFAPYVLETTAVKATKAGGADWYYNYLKRGFVLCFVGERGINTVNADKEVIGRGAVGLADLKAGVRFLKYNEGKFPGDTDKIISNGISAGGAMSMLLGSSGNSPYFDGMLKEMGACMDATDDVFATQAYCPITDLEHAPLAYEWQWQAATEGMTGFTLALSQKLAAAYATYFNGLELSDNGVALTLASDGSKEGSFCDWLLAKYESSFETYIAQGGSSKETETYDWLSYDEETGKATISATDCAVALDEIPCNYSGAARYKACVAFDDLDFGATGDNALFGAQNTKATDTDAVRHFSQYVAEAIESMKDTYPAEYEKYYRAYYDQSHLKEVEEIVRVMNPFNYIMDETVNKAEHFRINVGTADPHTSPTVSASLALYLQKYGFDTEYNLLWKQIHTDADTVGAFEDWVDSICL